MSEPTYTLRQFLAAVAAADYGYAEFCRRLGLREDGSRSDGLRASVLWDSWKRLHQPLADFAPEELARLLADERPFTVEEILKQEG